MNLAHPACAVLPFEHGAADAAVSEAIDMLNILATLLASPGEIMLSDAVSNMIERTRLRLIAARTAMAEDDAPRH